MLGGVRSGIGDEVDGVAETADKNEKDKRDDESCLVGAVAVAATATGPAILCSSGVTASLGERG